MRDESDMSAEVRHTFCFWVVVCPQTAWPTVLVEDDKIDSMMLQCSGSRASCNSGPNDGDLLFAFLIHAKDNHFP